MTDHERKHLIRALRQYESGMTHAGDYQLWVGFGDHWRGFKDRLVKRGYLRISSSGTTELSSKGEGFCDHIRRNAA